MNFPNKKYKIIYADPPWDIGGYVHSGNHVDLPYQTMTDDEIVLLPISQIVDSGAVSPNLHRYLMDHKDADHKSAEAVIYGLIGENDELRKREAWSKVKENY